MRRSRWELLTGRMQRGRETLLTTSSLSTLCMPGSLRPLNRAAQPRYYGPAGTEHLRTANRSVAVWRRSPWLDPVRLRLGRQ
ncbi:hypothetical protein BO82DRAFT_125744 [Aspergillus uvarum CBS 121591]|uniref:Uncharacterized protein n=1 Tax=Aspergillus uvarum CBS 121591 TaxID=1448315 RepID=A0A319C3I3_9EURO|nr:hypothetical protein BO82DRAFT_125744 [Aspergillus uvarum CBS 121591]PYH79684.1 hypothetical protein BO82DRAFT_125744 [Aspergillus uvarum CBS 121591]